MELRFFQMGKKELVSKFDSSIINKNNVCFFDKINVCSIWTGFHSISRNSTLLPIELKMLNDIQLTLFLILTFFRIDLNVVLDLNAYNAAGNQSW